MAPLTRRHLLKAGAGAALFLVGCGADSGGVADAQPFPTADADPAAPDAPPMLDATPQCEEGPTEDNIQGPFYRAGAPMKSNLVEAGDPGVRITISGSVFTTSCQIVAGTLIDIWQADDAAVYDLAGFQYRGKVTAGADGVWTVDTIIPGNYLNGAQYRPAHIHVTVTAAGMTSVTTQLYFEGDPYNSIDPFIRPSLIMPLTDAPGGGKAARFDFVLAPV